MFCNNPNCEWNELGTHQMIASGPMKMCGLCKSVLTLEPQSMDEGSDDLTPVQLENSTLPPELRASDLVTGQDPDDTAEAEDEFFTDG